MFHVERPLESARPALGGGPCRRRRAPLCEAGQFHVERPSRAGIGSRAGGLNGSALGPGVRTTVKRCSPERVPRETFTPSRWVRPGYRSSTATGCRADENAVQQQWFVGPGRLEDGPGDFDDPARSPATPGLGACSYSRSSRPGCAYRPTPALPIHVKRPSLTGGMLRIAALGSPTTQAYPFPPPGRVLRGGGSGETSDQARQSFLDRSSSPERVSRESTVTTAVGEPR